MKQGTTTIYPDVADILARKAEGRREIAVRSFGEKIAMVERLRERLASFKRARERRREAKASGAAVGSAPITVVGRLPRST
jgi:hypothetical protein